MSSVLEEIVGVKGDNTGLIRLSDVSEYYINHTYKVETERCSRQERRIWVC